MQSSKLTSSYIFWIFKMAHLCDHISWIFGSLKRRTSISYLLDLWIFERDAPLWPYLWNFKTPHLCGHIFWIFEKENIMCSTTSRRLA